TNSDQFDPNTANNSASATETPQQADLALTKTVDNPTPNVGDIITFTVVLTNNGPNVATNVAAQEMTSVSGLAFVSATPSQGIFDQTNLLWTVGTLAVGATATITVQARALSSNPITNIAAITHSDQFDPNPANNSNSVTVRAAEADLAVTKTVDN